MNRRLTFFIYSLFCSLLLRLRPTVTWLLPKQGRVTPGTKVARDLTSGMAFPLLDTSIKPDRIDMLSFKRQTAKVASHSN